MIERRQPRTTSTRLDADVHSWIKKQAFDNRRTFSGELNVILREVFENKKAEEVSPASSDSSASTQSVKGTNQ